MVEGLEFESKTRGNIGREEGKTERKDGANIAKNWGRYSGDFVNSLKNLVRGI